jgi:hypothetical protein
MAETATDTHISRLVFPVVSFDTVVAADLPRDEALELGQIVGYILGMGKRLKVHSKQLLFGVAQQLAK